MLIELSKEQKNNLMIFLNRVDLKGNEVIAFVEILQAVQNAEEKPKKVGE